MKKIFIPIVVLTFFPMLVMGQNPMLVIEEDSAVNCMYFTPEIFIQDTLNNANSTYSSSFDLDDDQSADIKFNVDAFHPQMGPSIGTADILILDTSLQLACDTTFYAWPDTLKEGDTLQDQMRGNVWTSLLEWPQYQFNLRYIIVGNGGVGGTGLWQNAATHYAGFRSVNNTDTLYGYFALKVEVTDGSAQLWISKVCYQGIINEITGNPSPSQPVSEITLYPNPFHSVITIRSSTQQQYSGSVIDLFGRSVQKFSFSGSTEIAISSLPGGNYFLILDNTTNQKREIYKLIKE